MDSWDQLLEEQGGTTPPATPTNDTPGGGGTLPPPNSPQGNEGGDTPPATPPEDVVTPLASAISEPAKTVMPHDVFGDDFKDKDWTVAGTEVKTRLQKAAEYEKEIETLRSTPPAYANETVAKYDSWIKNGGVEDFAVFKTVANFTPEMNDIDALVAKEIIENPKLIGSEQFIKDRILKQYPTADIEGEPPLSEGQITYNQGLLSGEAAKAKDFIKAQGAKMQLPQSATPVDQAAVLATNKANWSTAIGNLLSKITALPVKVPKTEGANTTFENYLDYQIPEAEIKQTSEVFINAFSQVGDVDESSIIACRDAIKKELVFNNLPFIVKAAVDKNTAQLIEEYDKKYAGAVLKEPGASSNGTGSSNSQADDIDRLIKEVF